MRTLLVLCFSICILSNTFGQKKVKGNKIVMTEEKIVEAFHTIELHDNFNVILQEETDHIIKIEADSNLQEYISIEVQDSILKVKSTRELRRAKALNITILYGAELQKIRVHDKVNLTAKSPIYSSVFSLNAHDNTEVFLTIEAQEINSFLYGKSKADLHISSTKASYQVNENADLEGIITSDSLQVDLYQKASAKLEGEIKSLRVRADGNTDFYGEKLISEITNVIAEGSSDCYVVSNQEIDLEAIDKSEVYILGEPKINISKFANEAILYKKEIDYSPSKLKL